MRFRARAENAVALAIASYNRNDFGVGEGFHSGALCCSESHASEYARIKIGFVGNPKSGSCRRADGRFTAVSFRQRKGPGAQPSFTDLLPAFVALSFPLWFEEELNRAFRMKTGGLP